MYISKKNALNISFSLEHARGKAEEIALIDSGATGNFIDYKTVARLRLGTTKLQQPLKVRNVDETPNKNGLIDNVCQLWVKRGTTKDRQNFYVTNLGSDRFILGYPWLKLFNPEIDWAKGYIKGPPVQAETLAARRLRYVKSRQESIKRTNISQQMSHEYAKTHPEPKTTTIPPQFLKYEEVFSETAAKKLPPS